MYKTNISMSIHGQGHTIKVLLLLAAFLVAFDLHTWVLLHSFFLPLELCKKLYPLWHHHFNDISNSIKYKWVKENMESWSRNPNHNYHKIIKKKTRQTPSDITPAPRNLPISALQDITGHWPAMTCDLYNWSPILAKLSLWHK